MMEDPNEETETVEEMELGYKIWLLIRFSKVAYAQPQYEPYYIDQNTTYRIAKEILQKPSNQKVGMADCM